jgi:hypothetical protein
VREGKSVIEKYEFGQLRVDGKQYQHDVIIYPGNVPGRDRVNADWWRKEGHRLDEADLNEVLEAKPEMLVVGTGYYGRMKVPEETIEFLANSGIEVSVLPTKEACEKYNQLRASRKVVATLHLTC